MKSILGYHYDFTLRCIRPTQRVKDGCGGAMWIQRIGEYEWWHYCCLCDVTVKHDYGEMTEHVGLHLPEKVSG